MISLWDMVFHENNSKQEIPKLVFFFLKLLFFKALTSVQCVPWYMPQHGSFPICGPWQTSQFQKVMGRSFSANHTESGCLPDCQSVKYTYTLSQVIQLHVIYKEKGKI